MKEILREGDDGNIVDEGVGVVSRMSDPGTSLLLLRALVLSDVVGAGNSVEGSVDGAVASRDSSVGSVEGGAAEVRAESLEREDVGLRVWVGGVAADNGDLSFGRGGEGESSSKDLKKILNHEKTV